LRVATLDTVNFYSTCISHNKPCALYGMAKTWPAWKNWSYKEGGMEYLAKKFGDEKVRVFVNEDEHIHPESNVGYSFDKLDAKTMGFNEFLPLMSEKKTGASLRDRSKRVRDILGSDITYPPFYNDIGELSGVEFMMG